MTEQFYIAVKGSLHSSDSSVFGLTVEEVNALSKRYPDSNREVINGVLIKASPLRVINSLCELGYRVVCSSGEAEIVWTLRREVLPVMKKSISKRSLKNSSQILIRKKVSDSKPKKVDNILKRKDEQSSTEVRNKIEKTDIDMHKRILLVLEEGKFTITNDGRLENILQQVNLVSENENNESLPVKNKEENKKKKVEKIGSKPEDFATYSNYKGPKIVIRNPSSLEMLDEAEEGGIIVNSNMESPQNPFASSSYYSPKKHYFNDMESPFRHNAENHDCLRSSSNPLLHQTLDEMDFERGIWMPAMSGDVEGVKCHLNRGTPPDIEDRSGYTPLHYAARCGHPQVCTLLIKAGASLDKPTRAGGATALHRAALAGHHEICCILLRYGANLRARDVDERTPLHRAVEGGHQAVIIEFLQYCPEAAFDKDSKGKSPLSYAEEKGSLSSLFVDFLKTHK